MAILAFDDVMLREPRLLVPGMQPLGLVKPTQEGLSMGLTHLLIPEDRTKGALTAGVFRQFNLPGHICTGGGCGTAYWASGIMLGRYAGRPGLEKTGAAIIELPANRPPVPQPGVREPGPPRGYERREHSARP